MGDSVMDSALIDSQRVSESIVVDEWLAKWKGYKSYKRVQAFVALDGEREYQESLHKKTGQDPISLPGELALLQVYLNKALMAYAETFGDPGEKPTMDIIRKITAIGLRALENYGCPLRDIAGSLAARPPEHRARPDKAGFSPGLLQHINDKPGTPDLKQLDGRGEVPDIEMGAAGLHEIDGANQD